MSDEQYADTLINNHIGSMVSKASVDFETWIGILMTRWQNLFVCAPI